MAWRLGAISLARPKKSHPLAFVHWATRSNDSGPSPRLACVSVLVALLIATAVLVVSLTTIGVVRSRVRRAPLPPTSPVPQVVAPSRPLTTTDEVQTDQGVAEPAGEVVPGEIVPEEIVRPRFRDRLEKARSLLGDYFGSVLGRSEIDQTTWDAIVQAGAKVGFTV